AQRADLLRCAEQAADRRPRGAPVAPGRLAVHRPLREPQRCQRRLASGAAVHVSPGAGMSALTPASACAASGQGEPGTRAVRATAGTAERIIAIGTSTGGTQALETVLRRLPRTVPGIVIV